MYQFVESKSNIGSSILAANIIKTKNDEGLEYYVANFPGGRVKWAMFENEHYDKNVKQFEDGDEEIKKFFKGPMTIPKYHIFKDTKKIGFALPRNAHNAAEEPYLVIPETLVANRTKMKKYCISRTYYIFEVNENHIINDKNARLLFYQ